MLVTADDSDFATRVLPKSTRQFCHLSKTCTSHLARSIKIDLSVVLHNHVRKVMLLE